MFDSSDSDQSATLLNMAHWYARRERNGLILGQAPVYADLDEILTWRPWQSDERQRTFLEARERGLVRPAPSFASIVAEESVEEPDAMLSAWLALFEQEDAIARLKADSEGMSNLPIREQHWLVEWTRDMERIRKEMEQSEQAMAVYEQAHAIFERVKAEAEKLKQEERHGTR